MEKPKPGRPGSRGSTILIQSSLESPVGRENLENIPVAARMLEPAQPLWTNNRGQVQQRQVVGDKVLIRQQPAAPPASPEILLLSDQMLSNFQHNDKYMKCLSMVGYTLKDYANGIKDQMIDVNYLYVLCFIGIMQLGLFDPKVVQKQAAELVKVINHITPNTMVVFSGLIPRPLDHQRSRVRCQNYSKMYVNMAEELRKKGYNCVAIPVFHEFLDGQGNIVNMEHYFVDNIFLSPTGI